jgi:hypothetical protein
LHAVEIIETVVRQLDVLAHRKKWLFCKVISVSIQAFMQGLLILANVLEATNRTLKNVNNICTLAINSAKHVVLFSGVTLAYSCVRLWHFCPHQQVSQIVWLFEGNHRRLRRYFGQFGYFSTDVQCPRMVLELFLRQGWCVRMQGVLLQFCFSLYWSKLLLEMLWALLKLFLIILCL